MKKEKSANYEDMTIIKLDEDIDTGENDSGSFQVPIFFTRPLVRLVVIAKMKLFLCQENFFWKFRTQKFV